METHDVFVHENGVFNHVFLFSNFSDHFQMTFEHIWTIPFQFKKTTALQDAVAMGPLSFSELWPNHSGSRWLNSVMLSVMKTVNPGLVTPQFIMGCSQNIGNL